MNINFIECFYYFNISYITCFCLDKFAILLYKIRNKNMIIPYSQNIRWFFIHFIVNLYITIYGFNDVKYSITNMLDCSEKDWVNGFQLYIAACALHLYHIFHFNLNKMDWLHHILMALISIPITLLYNTKCTSVVGIWFTSGLPGAIDYFVLWLVKMKYCSVKFEKTLYIYINVWLRSPGCIYATLLQIPFIYNINSYTNIEICAKIWLMCILFWNGQFFMHMTLKDYYRKNIQ